MEEKIAPDYSDVVFTSISNSTYFGLKKKLDITRKQFPALTIVSPNNGISYRFPDDWEHTEDNIRQFIKNYKMGKLRPIKNERFTNTQDTRIERRMRDTTQLSQYDFEQVVMDRKKDVAVYFYSSEDDSKAWKKSLDMMTAFDQSSDRFKDHEIETVTLVAYDWYGHGAPDAVDLELKIPSVVMFPATRKQDPVIFDETP
jgi:hypothetical protein